MPDLLRGRGWVLIGTTYSTDAAPGSLDAHLKTFLKRATAGWVAVVLETAGVITVDRACPERIKLRPYGHSPAALAGGPKSGSLVLVFPSWDAEVHFLCEVGGDMPRGVAYSVALRARSRTPAVVPTYIRRGDAGGTGGVRDRCARRIRSGPRGTLAPTTRRGKADALSVFFQYLELRHAVEIYNLTGRAVQCPLDEMNRRRGRNQLLIQVPPSHRRAASGRPVTLSGNWQR